MRDAFLRCIDLRDYSLYGASMRRGSLGFQLRFVLYRLIVGLYVRCLVTLVRQFSSYTHISVPHRRSTCCVLAPVENDVRWCGCAPPQSVECGARTPLASSPHPTQPPTSTAHPHITGYGLRSTHVVFERGVSPNPGAVHRRFITPPRRPCMYLRCRTDGVQRHGAPPVACLHLRGPSRVGIPAASLGT